jgi:hypothetical protein
MANRVGPYQKVGERADSSANGEPTESTRTKPTKPSQGSSPLQKLRTGADNVSKVDAHGFAPWGGFNLGSGIVTVLSAFNITSPAELSAAINAGVLPLALVDVLTTFLSNVTAVANYRAKTTAFKDAQTKKRDGGMGAFEYVKASGEVREARGDAWRAIFPCARDVVGGLAGGASRIDTLATGASLWGTNAGVAPDCTFGALSCVTYVAAGALQSQKVDRAVDRAMRVNEAAHRAASGPQTVAPADLIWLHCLDSEFGQGKISPNVYETLRARPPQDVQRFLMNWWKLSPQKQKRLAKLLHFSGAQKGVTAFNMTRTTNLNTASVRRAARDAVIDAFVSETVPDAWKAEDGDHLCPKAAQFFDKLKVARKEALGAQVAPGVAELKDRLASVTRTNAEERGANVVADELGENVLRAIERSGHREKFVARYATLDKSERAELREIFHFGSWRFWKKDASLPTTKYQRADIRAKLAQRFAEGTSLHRLRKLKVRYNQKVVPLRTARTHSGREVDDTMIHFVLAAQDTKLDALKEEKRDAKIKLAYGLANGAAAVAEGVVNPGAVTGVSATRAILSAPYLVYAARRGLGNFINRRNAVPLTGAVREEAVLRLLPEVRKQISADMGQKKFIRAITSPHAFLRAEVGLSEKQIDKAIELERAGKMDALRAYLVRKNPHANVLIALRQMAEKPHDGNADERFKELKAQTLDIAVREPSALIEQSVRDSFPIDPRLIRDGQVADAVAKHKRLLAQDNPVLATRLFVDDLLSTDRRIAAGARNVLREFRFGEMEIRGLTRLGQREPEKVSAVLQDHLLGEGLRRRFSVRKLSKKARSRAAHVVPHVRIPKAHPVETLMWRHAFEEKGVDVIDNAGKPGLDSMLYALQQHFEGKTDCSSSKMRRRMAEVRNKVMAAFPPGYDLDGHLADNLGTIVEVASRAFGKPNAAVIVSETYPMQGRAVHEFGPKLATPAAVLCYDNQTNRTFVLDGVDEPPASPAPQQPEVRRPEVPPRPYVAQRAEAPLPPPVRPLWRP